MRVKMLRRGKIDQTTGKLLNKWVRKIKVNGVYCTCGYKPSREEYVHLLTFSRAMCPECSSTYNIDETIVRIEAGTETYPILQNTRLAANRTWFHSTRIEGWEKKVSDIPYVHVGIHHAAIDRALSNTSRKGVTPVFLHEVRLVESARISKTVLEDSEVEDYIRKNEDDVCPYINRWEGMGQISLLSKGSAIEVVKTSVVSVTELLSFVTAYNLAL